MKTIEQWSIKSSLFWIQATLGIWMTVAAIESRAAPSQAISDVQLNLTHQEGLVSGTLPEVRVSTGSKVLIDVPETIQLKSVRTTTANAVKIGKFELTPFLGSPDALLEAALGARVLLNQGPERAALDGVLVAGSPLMVQTAAGLQSVQLGDLTFPDLVLSHVPALVMTMSGEGALAGRLQYAASGLSWTAVYELSFSPASRQVLIAPWAEINNDTRHSFRNAELLLTAGQLNRAQSGSAMRPEYSTMRLSASDQRDDFGAESAGLYHQWRLPQRSDVPRYSQIKLPLQKPFKAEAEIFYRINSQVQRYRSETDAQAATVPAFLSVQPEPKNSAPMAAGIARVFSMDSQGRDYFQGEASLRAVPEGKAFEVKLGQAFDVRLGRQVTSFRVIGNRAREIGLELVLENTGQSDAKVTVIESMGSDFTVSDASPELTRAANQSLRADLVIAPFSQQTLTYRVRLNY